MLVGAPSVPPGRIAFGSEWTAGVTEAAPREGMHIPLRQQLLEQVLHIITLARPLVETVARRDRDLGSQIRRALSSVGLNISEGFGSRAGNARLRFESARGSLYEAQAGLRLAIAWGCLSAQACAPVLAAIDRLGARVFGLSQR